MAVYKNAVVMFAGGETADVAARTIDWPVALLVEMPTWDTQTDLLGSAASIVVKAPEGYEIATAEIADDSSYVTILFTAAGGGGGGGEN